ncbi:GlxA family transcriptional regulator [Gymnodinialimonas phycosphaerae]|nr:helix-turn-helix domain-containing protein [Gymnodinialimonas phycosphaerae]
MIEPLRAANEISKTETFEWVLVSEAREKVLASAGVSFEADIVLRSDLAVDCLILLAAPNSPFEAASTAGHLRGLARHGTTLGAVSGGVFPLTRSGVQVRDAISVHWCYAAAFEAEFPNTPTSDQVIEVSDTILTASGAAAAFDLSLQLIRTRLGEATATEVACWFQHPMMRTDDVRQSIPTISSVAKSEQSLPANVARVIDIYSAALSDPPRLSDVADAVGISPRQLERSFKKATGLNPSNYLRRMRMKAARQLVMYTNQSFTEIAEAVGYSSTSILKRYYTEVFGLSPREDRERINLFRVNGNVPVPAI